MKPQIIVLLTVIGLLSACGSSPPFRQYLLQPTVVEQAQAFDGMVGIGPVSVAEYLREAAIVTSRDGYQLTAAGLDHWGEPLDVGITRVVAENMVALTGSDKVRLFPWRSDEQPALALKIEVLHLNASDHAAVLRLRWALRRAGLQQPLEEGYARYQQSLSSLNYDDIARAYSELLAQFSRDMAARLASAVSADATRPQ